jgi:enterochelin esterase-like enzyme
MKDIMLMLMTCLMANCTAAGEVDSIAVFSTAMKKEVKCVVIKPSGYNIAANRFPVVYLLHGVAPNVNG